MQPIDKCVKMEKKSITGDAMRMFEKSHKLDNVCYDIRGPVMDEADRMAANGIDILKLNIGNPAPFHPADSVS